MIFKKEIRTIFGFLKNTLMEFKITKNKNVWITDKKLAKGHTGKSANEYEDHHLYCTKYLLYNKSN